MFNYNIYLSSLKYQAWLRTQRRQLLESGVYGGRSLETSSFCLGYVGLSEFRILGSGYVRASGFRLSALGRE